MGAWPDLIGHQDLPSWPDSLYASWGALLSWASGKVGTQLLKKNQPQNSTQYHGTSQEEAAEQHIYHPPTWEKAKPVSSPQRAEAKSPWFLLGKHGATTEGNFWFSALIQAGTRSYTEQRDAGHCRQNWDTWTWWVSFLHFLTASNIVIVTHNTREYNCCSDYLQPLH